MMWLVLKRRGNGRRYCTRASALEIIRIEINGKMINLGKVDVLG